MKNLLAALWRTTFAWLLSGALLLGCSMPPTSISPLPAGTDGSAARGQWFDLRSAGARIDGTTNDDLAWTAAQAATNGLIYVPPGTSVVSAFPDMSRVIGEGFISKNGTSLPAGDIRSDLTIPYPDGYADFSTIFEYLGGRRILGSATVTISIASGEHVLTGQGIVPRHVDGGRIHIVGQGKDQTTLKFTALGSGTSKAGVQLVGDYELGLLDGLTLDGDAWNGHAAGSPLLGSGDVNDPMGIQAKEGAVIRLGTNVRVRQFARNGVFAYQGSTIKADYVEVIETGSDGIVASTGSTVRAISAKVQDCWGVGIFADYAGTIWASGAVVSGTKYRFGGAGGDGFSAANGGTIYAENSTSLKNSDSGYTAHSGLIVANGAKAGGAANGNSGSGLRCQYGGRFIGDNVTASHNVGGGMVLTGGGQFHGLNLNTSNNGSHGASVVDGSLFVSQGFLSHLNSGRGLSIDRGSVASILNCDIQGNTGDGISNNGARVRASSAVAVKSNGGMGIITRRGGITDMEGVSESLVVTGNAAGSFSPAKDTTSGIGQSFNYGAN